MKLDRPKHDNSERPAVDMAILRAQMALLLAHERTMAPGHASVYENGLERRIGVK